jgi:hypothetical protein
MNITNLATNYFEYFNNYDIDGLTEIYDIEIKLIDWNGKWSGINKVINVNKSLFAELKPSITITEINEIDEKAFCKINISIGDEILKVMDVIEFNKYGKIIKIEAFKG